MNIARIKLVDIADGLGCRTTIFVSGCRRQCKGCQNPETWDFLYGIPYTIKLEKEILDSIEPYYIRGLTICGGEPFEPENESYLVSLAASLKKRYGDGKDIWAYSGYTYEELSAKDHGLLKYIDVLVDGPFIEEKKDISLRFRGSNNQHIYLLKEGKVTGELDDQ